MSNVDKAMQLFREGHSCAQTMRMVYGDPLGVPEETAKFIANEFAQGLHTGRTCGAVSGAFTAIVQRHLSASSQPETALREIYALFTDFADQFTKRNAHMTCFDLLGCDIDTEEGMKKIREQGLFKIRCLKFVKDSAEILEVMLADKLADNH